MIKGKYIEICRNETPRNKIPPVWLAMSEYHIRGCISMISMLIKHGTLPEKEKLIELLYELDCHFDILLDKLENE